MLPERHGRLPNFGYPMLRVGNVPVRAYRVRRNSYARQPGRSHAYTPPSTDRDDSRMKTMAQVALRAALATTTILGASVALTAPAAAQTTTASIRGQVRDGAGAPVAGATVVAVNGGTNQTFRATSSAGGAYVLNGLRPAPYTVTVTGPNGEVFVRSIVIGIGQATTLDATLAPAAA
ncbi:MAG: carboxypeptidase regulatory-like domain-containing protein, partial [Sphingomonas sp.]